MLRRVARLAIAVSPAPICDWVFDVPSWVLAGIAAGLGSLMFGLPIARPVAGAPRVRFNTDEAFDLICALLFAVTAAVLWLASAAGALVAFTALLACAALVSVGIRRWNPSKSPDDYR